MSVLINENIDVSISINKILFLLKLDELNKYKGLIEIEIKHDLLSSEM